MPRPDFLDEELAVTPPDQDQRRPAWIATLSLNPRVNEPRLILILREKADIQEKRLCQFLGPSRNRRTRWRQLGATAGCHDKLVFHRRKIFSQLLSSVVRKDEQPPRSPHREPAERLENEKAFHPPALNPCLPELEQACVEEIGNHWQAPQRHESIRTKSHVTALLPPNFSQAEGIADRYLMAGNEDCFTIVENIVYRTLPCLDRGNPLPANIDLRKSQRLLDDQSGRSGSLLPLLSRA